MTADRPEKPNGTAVVACLLLDVNAVGLVRGRNPDRDFLPARYVNDRPHVASSLPGGAIVRVAGSAL